LTTLRLLEKDGAGEPGVAERLLDLLGPEGALRRLIEEEPLDEETSESLERTILHWRGSERRLQPVLEFLRGSGHTQMADALEPLDPAGAPITYWILGEGDHALGPGILSYRAPILKPLLGKPEGTQVMLELPEGERPYRIASIRKRLPDETA